MHHTLPPNIDIIDKTIATIFITIEQTQKLKTDAYRLTD